MRDLSNRAAVITGASTGLGPHLARALAAEGARLVLAARNEPALESVAADLRARGSTAIVVRTDVTRAEDRRALVERATRELGAIDVLVNNAGVEHAGDFHLLPEADIAQVIDVNLTSTLLLTRLVVPGMLERGRGFVVNMASLSAKGCPPFMAPYAASKAGLVAFTRSLRSEYRSRGVSATAIVPGFVTEAGMYHRNVQASGTRATKIIGEVTPAEVARAMVRAIRNDTSEIIVSPGPMRLMAGLGELFPPFTEWATRTFGGSKVLRSFVDARARE